MKKLKKSRTATIAAAAAAVVAVLFAAVFYYTVDPSSGWMPRCTFKVLTGYDCPGCGFQRALHALLHGHVAEAWSCNAFVFFAVPAAIFYIVLENIAAPDRCRRLRRLAFSPLTITAIGAAIIIWWIGRNIAA